MLCARAVVAVTLLASAAACAGPGSSVQVTRIGSAGGLQPRPKGCTLEWLRDEPKRPYREIAHLASQVNDRPRADPLDVLHNPACELGADAIIVTSEHGTRSPGHHFVAGTAIVYLEPPPSSYPQEQQPTPPSEQAPGSVNL